MANLLIGSYPARLDASGRLKIPEKFREAIETGFGREVFVTSLADESVQAYPLAVWERMTGIAAAGALQLRPDVRRFLLRVNRAGQRHEIDSKGRLLIAPALREKARLADEVEVIGLQDHVEIWNKDVLDEVLERKPLTDGDFEAIAGLFPRGSSE